MKFDIWVFFENLWRKFKSNSDFTKVMRTLHKDMCTSVIISRSKVVEKIKTHILLSIIFFFFRNSCPLLDNVEKYGTARQATVDSIIRRTRFLCCFTKVIDPHSEYVIFIAFPWQQWLYERASMLKLYVHCLSCYFSSGFVLQYSKLRNWSYLALFDTHSL